MKYWEDIKKTLSDPFGHATQLLLLLLGVYTLILAQENRRWKIPVLAIGIFCWFFYKMKEKRQFVWITLFVLLVIDLVHDYFWVANHHFMLLFLVFSVILYNFHQRGAILFTNVKMILGLVILASVVQKVTSSQFMSGQFYYVMINQGSLFRQFINFFPDYLSIVRTNAKAISAFQASDPNVVQNIVLIDLFPKLPIFSKFFAWFTVVFEFIVAMAILLKPKAIGTHLVLIGLISGILLTRLETGFMGMLAICGVFLCPHLKLRLLYVLLFMACLILIVTKIGYH